MQSPSTKRVSIIIPTYNRCNFLLQAIASILSQWNDDYEIVVIDDGSTDDTREKLHQYIDSETVKYIYQANSGKPSVARNRGISMAEGEFICFLDSDDYLTADSIQKRVDILEKYKSIALVSSDWIDITENGKETISDKSWVVKEDFINKIPGQFIDDISNGCIVFNRDIVNYYYTREFVFTSSVMIRKSILIKLGCFDEYYTISEDRDLWMRVSSNYLTAYINEPLVFKRRHAANITNNSIAHNYLQDRHSVEKFIADSNVLNGKYREVAMKQLTLFYHKIGMYFWYQSEVAEARYAFSRAVRYRSRNARTYIYLLCTFLPGKLVEAVRSVKKYAVNRIVGLGPQGKQYA